MANSNLSERQNSDSGSITYDGNRKTLSWTYVGAGDGMYSAFDPISATPTKGKWFTEAQNGFVLCSDNGIQNLDYCVGPWRGREIVGWSAPLKLDNFNCAKNDCRNVIFGAEYVYVFSGEGVPASDSRVKSGNKKLTKGIGFIFSLDFSLADPKAIVAGTTDGNVQISNDVFTGTNCTKAAANSVRFSCKANPGAGWINITQDNRMLPNRAVTAVAFDPRKEDVVYAAVSGYNINTPATPGHVFQARKSGNSWTWTNKSGNLPDLPVWSMVINPNNGDQAFLGTESGFFYTNDIGAASPKWFRYQKGLPNTVVLHLSVDRGPESAPFRSTTLTAFTYGRGVYSIKLPGAAGF